MAEWISSNLIEYFNAIEKATRESKDSELDVRVMDYIGSIVAAINAENIRDLSQKGIIGLDYEMIEEQRERKSNKITLANNGEHLVIIQVINPLNEMLVRSKDELQIGIILNRTGRIVKITVLEESKKIIEKEDFYSEVLDTAEQIRENNKKESATGIKRLLYNLKDNLFWDEEVVQPKSLNPIALTRIIRLFRETTGEEAIETYIRKKENKMRKERITHTVTPWKERLKAELSMTEEERKQVEEEAQRRRKEIVMTQHKSDNDNNSAR